MNKYKNLVEIQNALKLGELSSAQLVEHYLSNIDKNTSINAFLEVFREEAIDSAKALDLKRKKGKNGKLDGMVIAIKDNIAYKGHRFSASSKLLDGFESIYSSTVVERLIKEDAIIIGRTNCDEFAMGSSNENSAFGPVLNPLNSKRVSGGSSGGSAAAVKADMCLAALGTDTGGSIRQPASFCGVYGMKPTYGRVSRHGIIAFASSFDQVGPFAKSVEDCAAIVNCIAGPDEFDSTCRQLEVPDYPVSNTDSKLRIAVLKGLANYEGVEESVKTNYVSYLKALEVAGHEIVEKDFMYLDYVVPTYYILTTAEASSNLSRYSGILYGKRAENSGNLEDTYKKSRAEGFGEEVKRRIMLGTFVLSEGYYDAYYGKAQKVRRLLKEKATDLLSDCDLLLTPTAPSTAFGLGEIKDPIQMYLADIFTVFANLAGCPSISMPIFTDDAGMPFGMQIMCKNFEEGDLFNFAKTLSEARP